MKNVLDFFLKSWIKFSHNIIIYNFIFICMIKKKVMELWFEISYMHNEFQDRFKKKGVITIKQTNIITLQKDCGLFFSFHDFCI